MKYFYDKSGKLLVIDLEKNDNKYDIKKLLGDFFKVDINFEIPHENKNIYKKIII